MRRAVHVVALLLAAWTVVHLVFVAFPDHLGGCDDCPEQPFSEWWVTALRVGAWSAAVVAVGRAHDEPSRARVAVMAGALVALAAAMLLLPTPPMTAGLA